MSLWIPDTEAARQAENARAEQARVLGLVELHHDLEQWNREIKRIDPYCQIVKAPDAATHPGLKPGHWHVLRTPPVGFPTLVVHEHPDGSFRDLDSSIFQTLRDRDMWRDERQRDREKRIKEAEKAEARAKEREREQRVEEIVDRAKAAFNPGVSMAPGWRYRAGARRG